VGGLSGANVAATARARPARRRGRQPRRGGRGAVGEAARHLPAARWRPATPLRAHTGAARAGGGDAHSFCNTSSHSTTRRAPTHTSCSAFALARARRRGRFSERGGSGGRAAGEAAEAARPAVDQPPAGVPGPAGAPPALPADARTPHGSALDGRFGGQGDRRARGGSGGRGGGRGGGGGAPAGVPIGEDGDASRSAADRAPLTDPSDDRSPDGHQSSTRMGLSGAERRRRRDAA
jgi:hypothetical protein